MKSKALSRFKPLEGPGRPGPAGKQLAILEDLRRMIVTGVYKRGDRLPTRTELKRAYDVSGLTVQWALQRLASDGFVQARGNMGTFVTETPPHLHRIGLVLDGPLPDGSVTAGSIAALLYREFQILRDRNPSDLFPVFSNCGASGSREGINTLLEHLRSDRLAGIVCESPFLPSRGELRDTLVNLRVPCVAVASGDQSYESHIKRLVAYHKRVLDLAMDHLVERKCKSIAVLDSNMSDAGVALLRHAAESRGLSAKRCHLLGVDPRSPHLARTVMELLMSSRHPLDGLIIADDSLVEQATLGLMDAGVHVPDDLVVVAHANFPYPSHAAVPARRVGIDLRHALEQGIGMIHQMRSGKHVPDATPLQTIMDTQ